MTDFFTAAMAIGGLETLDVDGMRLLYRVECAGEVFYAGIAAGVDNEEAAALFMKNGREERGHAERLRRALSIKLGHPYDPQADDADPLPVPLPEKIPVELLGALVQGELDGDAGYQRWADREPDEGVQRLLRLNGREESIHAQRVTAALEILNGTSAGASAS
jgi:rubrerythrin